MKPRLTVSQAMEQLGSTDALFKRVFAHGSLEVEIYAPKGEDHQTPHSRDELYVIASGSGYFVHKDDRQRVETGEVLFVPAKEEHRFEDFSDDFATWVVFYGPEGGEKEP